MFLSMKKVLLVIILAIIPMKGFCQYTNEDQMPDSMVVSCVALLNTISEFKIIVYEDSLLLSHRNWADMNTSISDYVCYNKDTISNIIQYYNEFSKVKTTYIDSNNVILAENCPGVVICTYSEGDRTCRDIMHDEYHLYPYSYIKFLAIIYDLLKNHIDIRVSFPFSTDIDPSFR